MLLRHPMRKYFLSKSECGPYIKVLSHPFILLLVILFWPCSDEDSIGGVCKEEGSYCEPSRNSRHWPFEAFLAQCTTRQALHKRIFSGEATGYYKWRRCQGQWKVLCLGWATDSLVTVLYMAHAFVVIHYQNHFLGSKRVCGHQILYKLQCHFLCPLLAIIYNIAVNNILCSHDSAPFQLPFGGSTLLHPIAKEGTSWDVTITWNPKINVKVLFLLNWYSCW
jgi:hypothetical protein